jgi:hypothetical protein
LGKFAFASYGTIPQQNKVLRPSSQDLYDICDIIWLSQYSPKDCMSRFRSLLVSSLLLLGLGSCGTPEASVPDKSAAPVKTETASNPAAGFAALQSVTEKTTTAVSAGKVDQAKTEFEKFEDSWKTVEDGVKAKSSKTYAAVEEGLDTMNGELKNKQPDKTKMLAALKFLTESIATASKP